MNPAAILNDSSEPMTPLSSCSRRESKEEGKPPVFNGSTWPSLAGFSNNLYWSRVSKIDNALTFHSGVTSTVLSVDVVVAVAAVSVEKLSEGLKMGVVVGPADDEAGASSNLTMGKLSKLAKALYSSIAFLLKNI